MMSTSDGSKWRKVTLKDVTCGNAFGPRFSSDLYSTTGNIGTIRTTDLDDEGKINYSTIPFAELLEDNVRSHLLNDGDLLITRSGTCGIPCIFESQEKPIVAGAFLIRFQLTTAVVPKFLHSLLKSGPLQRQIESMASGGVQKNLTGTNLLKLRFALPPLPEQQKIAAILSTWDRAIELTEKLIAAKQKRKQALMQQLLTGKVRLPQFARSKQWTTIMLGEVVSLSSGGTPSKANPDFWNGEVPWVTAKDLKRLLLTDSIDHVSEQALGNGTRLMPSGTVFVLVRGMTLLKDVPVCIASVPMCFNQDIRALTIQKDYDHRFIAYNLVASKQRLLSLVNVAGHGTGRLATEFLVELPIKVPPTAEEQSDVADFIEAADKEMTLLCRRVEKLRSQKKGLMQQLLTGKVRVNVDAETVKG